MIKKYSLEISSYTKGILIIFISKFIANLASFMYTLYQMSKLSIDEFKKVSTLPSYILIGYLTQLISAIGFIFAGYFIIKKLKGKTLFPSIILATIWLIISFLISFADVYSNTTRLNNFVQSFPFSAIKTVLFVTIGGFIAKYKNK